MIEGTPVLDVLRLIVGLLGAAVLVEIVAFAWLRAVDLAGDDVLAQPECHSKRRAHLPPVGHRATA